MQQALPLPHFMLSLVFIFSYFLNLCYLPVPYVSSESTFDLFLFIKVLVYVFLMRPHSHICLFYILIAVEENKRD